MDIVAVVDLHDRWIDDGKVDLLQTWMGMMEILNRKTHSLRLDTTIVILDIYNGSTSHLQTPLFLQHPF